MTRVYNVAERLASGMVVGYQIVAPSIAHAVAIVKADRHRDQWGAVVILRAWRPS